MNTFKRTATIIALSAAGMFSTQAFAAEAGVKVSMTPQTPGAFSQNDINGMFETTGKPMQLAALSKKEMKETEGAIWPYVVGAALGAVSYGAFCTIGKSCSTLGFVRSAAMGAASPIRAGAGAVAGIWAVNRAVGFGVANGVSSYYEK